MTKNQIWTYKDSGVDIAAGEKLVSKIKKRVRSTYGEEVRSGVGGFACLYRSGDRYLAAGTDGVGTKLKLAQELNVHNGVGIDLVAMCVNDILCTGAKPLFFMDYFSTGKLDVEIAYQVIDGVANGCEMAETSLIGGETAEMPGMYGEGEYDLAGFALGDVFPDKVIDGLKVSSGQRLIGLGSSGFHSNGYSLVRKLLREEDSFDFKKELLTPTHIYWNEVRPLLKKNLLTGIAHITGGGFDNISRINSGFDYHINNLSFLDDLPSSMKIILDRSQLSDKDLFKTFNMGIGLVLVTSEFDRVWEILKKNQNVKIYNLGNVGVGKGKVLF